MRSRCWTWWQGGLDEGRDEQEGGKRGSRKWDREHLCFRHHPRERMNLSHVHVLVWGCGRRKRERTLFVGRWPCAVQPLFPATGRGVRRLWSSHWEDGHSFWIFASLATKDSRYARCLYSYRKGLPCRKGGKRSRHESTSIICSRAPAHAQLRGELQACRLHCTVYVHDVLFDVQCVEHRC